MENATVRAPGRPTYAMRLATAERKLIEAAAATKGETLSEYIRRASLSAARRELLGDGV